MREHSLYLKDILEAMDAIERFVAGIEFEDFKNDDKTSSAFDNPTLNSCPAY